MGQIKQGGIYCHHEWSAEHGYHRDGIGCPKCEYCERCRKYVRRLLYPEHQIACEGLSLRCLPKGGAAEVIDMRQVPEENRRLAEIYQRLKRRFGFTRSVPRKS